VRSERPQNFASSVLAGAHRRPDARTSRRRRLQRGVKGCRYHALVTSADTRNEGATVHPCAKCGYPRTGLTPTTLCPECGTPSPLGRLEVTGGERHEFRWSRVFIPAFVANGIFGVIVQAVLPSLAAGACASLLLWTLVATAVEYRRSRREIRATWKCTDVGLAMARDARSETISWSAIDTCHAGQTLDRDVNLVVSGRTLPKEGRRLRCDTSLAEASILAERIREEIHVAALERALSLQKARTVDAERIAIRLTRGFPQSRLAVECVACGSLRPVPRATERCTCGAAGWDPSWTVVAVRSVLWVTRDEELRSSTSLTAVAAMRSGLTSALPHPPSPSSKARPWRTLAALALFAIVIYLVYGALPPRSAFSEPLDFWLWIPLLAVAILMTLGITLAWAGFGPPEALLVCMEDRVVILTDGSRRALRRGDAASFSITNAGNAIVVRGLDDAGAPTLLAHVVARRAVRRDVAAALRDRLGAA
jgi:hypothetical protein